MLKRPILIAPPNRSHVSCSVCVITGYINNPVWERQIQSCHILLSNVFYLLKPLGNGYVSLRQPARHCGGSFLCGSSVFLPQETQSHTGNFLWIPYTIWHRHRHKLSDIWWFCRTCPWDSPPDIAVGVFYVVPQFSCHKKSKITLVTFCEFLTPLYAIWGYENCAGCVPETACLTLWWEFFMWFLRFPAARKPKGHFFVNSFCHLIYEDCAWRVPETAWLAGHHSGSWVE